MEIYVENDAKLTLHGLQQYYVKLKPEEKNRKLADLLDALEFNQVVIFVSKGVRAKELDRLLKECNFPSDHVHGGMPQEERIKHYNAFRKFESRILVATNLFGRGIDIEHVNVVINYDFPAADEKSGEAPADQYLHRVGRAGRFGTKGLAISFVSSPEDEAALAEVQKRFAVELPELKDTIDSKTCACARRGCRQQFAPARAPAPEPHPPARPSFPRAQTCKRSCSLMHAGPAAET